MNHSNSKHMNSPAKSRNTIGKYLEKERERIEALAKAAHKGEIKPLEYDELVIALQEVYNEFYQLIKLFPRCEPIIEEDMLNTLMSQYESKQRRLTEKPANVIQIN